MLRSVYVNNFKSLLNCEYEPGLVNLLVGRNNAGKTNLCQALRFISLTARDELTKASAGATSLVFPPTNFYVRDDALSFRVDAQLTLAGVPHRFTYELSAKVGSRFTTNPELRVQSERLIVTGHGYKDTTLLLNNEGQVSLLHEGRFRRGDAESMVDTTAPTNTTMLFRLYDLDTNQLANAFKTYLGSWQYYDLNPASMRSTQATPGEILLRPDGSNLASVLHGVKMSRERTYRRLLEVVRALEPDLDAINFFTSPPENVLMIFELKNGQQLSVYNISNGTLRFTALTAILLTNLDRAQVLGIPQSPLVILEEPENGLYVGGLKPLMELVEEVVEAAPVQYVFTSHSPYLLDLFDRHLEDIRIIVRQETHSILKRPDIEKLQKLLQEFPLGEIHFREMWQ